VDTAAAERLAAFLAPVRRLVVLTGAGCSTASGIPDYRDDAGTWKQHRPMLYQEFLRHQHNRKRYWARSMLGWRRVARAAPNPAHQALASWESSGRLLGVITQNVDGLHQRAGSRAVVDLHGRLDVVECLDCGRHGDRHVFQRELERANPDWAPGRPATTTPDGDVDPGGVDYAGFELPACEHCGGPLKPWVVFFGENVPAERVNACYDWVRSADALLIVGTSLMVRSGYRFALAAAEAGVPVAAVNRGRTRADHLFHLKIGACCSEVLPAIAFK